MQKFILLALLLCYPTLAFGAPPMTSIPFISTSSTIPTYYTPCSDDEECDDLNPCTYDECEYNAWCGYSILGPVPCNDGLYCNGDDTCGESDGLCSIHLGDPCPQDTICNEDTDTCDPISGTSTTTSGPVSTTTTTLITGESFSISGHVTGAVNEDVSILLGGTVSETNITDTDGYYEFSDLASGFYTLKPERDGYSFEPPNYAIPNLVSVLVEMNFEATKTSCLVQSIYDEDSNEVQILRDFRDNVLSPSPEGRELIKLYYQWSPVIVKAMEADEDFKQEVKELVDGVLGMVGF